MGLWPGTHTPRSNGSGKRKSSRKQRNSQRLPRRPPREEFAMRVSVFVGTSVDGFIARLNGDLDFLPADGGEPHGYVEFIASVDVIVLGRKTFEKVLTLGPW